MFNPNKITKILGATFVLVSSNSVFAETINDATATVTVQNAFTFTESTPLDFGTIRATADQSAGANVANLVLAPTGTVTDAQVVNAAINSLVDGTPAVFTVAGAAPFTDLVVTFPADDSVILTGTALPGSAANFTITTWSAEVVGGLNDTDIITTAGTMQTDATGGVAMNVGATLETDDAGTAITQGYQDTAYTATYTVIVDYN